MSDLPYEVLCHEGQRDEWLETRRLGIGGSDMPSILGLTNWGSALSVQTDKWGLGSDESGEERDQKFRLAHHQEAYLLAELSMELGIDFETFGYLLRSKEYPWAMCTPDGVAYNEVCVDGLGPALHWAQCKTSIMKSEWEEEVPAHVIAQMQHEMLVTGADHSYLPVLLYPNTFAWKLVERDQKYIDEVIIPTGTAFWAATEERVPYEIDGSEQTTRALVRLHPEDNGRTVKLDDTYWDDVRALESIATDLKILNEQKTLHQNRVRAAIGDATYGELEDGSGFSWKTGDRKEYTVAASKTKTLRRVKTVGR